VSIPIVPSGAGCEPIGLYPLGSALTFGTVVGVVVTGTAAISSSICFDHSSYGIVVVGEEVVLVGGFTVIGFTIVLASLDKAVSFGNIIF
jgi:hypothetical protein